VKAIITRLPLKFEEALSDLLKVKPPPKPEKVAARKRPRQKRAVKKQ
jgi:hypothetical protein